jgi:transcriptional regulator with PAS, ATPase and Fis domain
MPEPLQAKLLRVIETESFYPIGDNQLREVDIRIVAATNKDIKAAVEAGAFRADLYYRLAVVPIKIPPLRERVADIALIAQSMFNDLKSQNKTSAETIDESVFSILQGYEWPGNVRELRNVVTHMALLAGGKVITANEIPFYMTQEGVDFSIPENYEELKNLKKTVKDEAVAKIETSFLRNALTINNWNVSKTAEATGIDRRLLQNMMKKYGITKP